MTLLESLARGVDVYDLAKPLWTGMPCAPGHPGFRMVLQRRHGDQVREDGGSTANELMITGGHVGTHVDAVGHVSQDGRLCGDLDAEAAQRGGRLETLGIDELDPLLCRGVLLDVAAVHGVDVLPGGYGITVADLEQAAERAGVTVATGDAVLVRTGWARRFDSADAYVGHDTGVPGLVEESARWLADAGARVIGADTLTCEQILPAQGPRVLPVHRLLLVERGINLVEVLDLEGLADAEVGEFMFVLAPLRIVGGTGSPVRPLAVVG